MDREAKEWGESVMTYGGFQAGDNAEYGANQKVVKFMIVSAVNSSLGSSERF